jgi:hypothetical protein
MKEPTTAPHSATDSPGLGQVTLVYTMFHHLGDFIVMGGLLRKFDLLGAECESIVAHQGSPHVGLFPGGGDGRFFNMRSAPEFLRLVGHLRRRKAEGGTVFGIPMAPGSIQAFTFFWVLKKLGALNYIVDFNLINADLITPPRRRYIFDRHLAQAAEILRRPEWLEEGAMPLPMASPARAVRGAGKRIGFHPWSGRGWLPEFQWSDSRWLALAKLILRDPGYEVVLVGRDEQFERLEQVLRAQLPEEMGSRFTSRPAKSVEALAASLQDVDGLVTVNTSALHLAHALKKPLVALCGSSAEMWLPEGKHVRLVRDAGGILPASDQYYHDARQPSLQRIGVAEVYAAFQELAPQIGPGRD